MQKWPPGGRWYAPKCVTPGVFDWNFHDLSYFITINFWHFVTFDISWCLTFHDVWHFMTFDISWRLTFHDVWHFMTFVISWHLSFDISWLLTFHNIWHFITFNVKWDFISFEISCNLTFHVIWVFISFEISCTIWDFMSFEFSWNLRFHVIWDWEWRNLKLIQMWRNFSFLHMFHVQKFEISPHDRFVLHGPGPSARDKYEVCYQAHQPTQWLSSQLENPTKYIP